jgi:hypothetical protein
LSKRTGGQPEQYEHKLAGPTRYPSNLILKHGLTDIETLWLWHQDVVQGKIERRTVDLSDGSDGAASHVVGRQRGLSGQMDGPELQAANGAVAVGTWSWCTQDRQAGSQQRSLCTAAGSQRQYGRIGHGKQRSIPRIWSALRRRRTAPPTSRRIWDRYARSPGMVSSAFAAAGAELRLDGP